MPTKTQSKRPLKTLDALPMPEVDNSKVSHMRHAATIIEVKESEVVQGKGFDSHRFFEKGNYCVVKRLYDGQTYTLKNGSINQVPERLRKVGQTGFVGWMRSPSYSLPYFTDQPK